jgi:GTP-sensing pleiotropic transcriptional regulator CodY
MSVELLDKTRKINQLLHNNNSSKVVFDDICAILSEILDSNSLVISKKGKVLGFGKSTLVDNIDELLHYEVGQYIRRTSGNRNSDQYRRRAVGYIIYVSDGKKLRDR